MNLLRLSALALTLFISAASCKKDDDGDDCATIQEANTQGIAPGGCVIVDPCAEPCDGNAICTADFRSVTVSAVDAVNNPVVIDSFMVTGLAGTPLPLVNGQPVYEIASDGRVTIANDAWAQGHQGMQMDVRAKGFSAGIQRFDEVFTIGADCCHVYKAGGPDVISVP